MTINLGHIAIIVIILLFIIFKIIDKKEANKKNKPLS